jgi:hypothetical protein
MVSRQEEEEEEQEEDDNDNGLIPTMNSLLSLVVRKEE